ncbi:MAG: hypothetical protein H6739_38055 [Alphaproteobacteria bacterium]|nr:hypothetical protein [Alphaproteobacteria bacterium]
MMSAVVMLLMLTDVALATAVFVALARPDVVIAFSFRTFGLGGDWFEEHVGEQELSRLRNLVRLGSWVGLGTVFAWSFAVGVMVTLMNLRGP